MRSLPDRDSRFSKFRRLAISMGAALVLLNTASAATVALPDGQATVASQFDYFTLEASGRAGKDHQRTGFRLAFPRFSDHVVLFLETQGVEDINSNIAFGNDVDVSGRASGGGFYITGLPDWRAYSLNLKLSGLSEELDVDSNITVSGIQAETTLRNRSVSAAIIVSPVAPMFDSGANAYLSLGLSYNRTRRNVVLSGVDQSRLYRYDTDFNPSVQAGIVYPFKRFAFFASVDYEQALALGLGIRLQLNR